MLKELLTNKKIALVGNGHNLLKSEYGKEIDNHDIVIRCNEGYPRKEYFQNMGERTDVWCCGLLRDKIINTLQYFENVKIIAWFSVHNIDKIPSLLKEKNLYINTINDFNNSKQKLNGNIGTTGFLCFNYIINNINFNKLNLYGFDFYNTPNFYNNKKANKKHNTELEKKIILKNLNENISIRQ